jgi:hypothetical protein
MARKAEVLGEKPVPRHFVHHKSHMTWLENTVQSNWQHNNPYKQGGQCSWLQNELVLSRGENIREYNLQKHLRVLFQMKKKKIVRGKPYNWKRVRCWVQTLESEQCNKRRRWWYSDFVCKTFHPFVVCLFCLPSEFLYSSQHMLAGHECNHENSYQINRYRDSIRVHSK